VEGSLGSHAGFRITPDFAGSQTVLFDAYGDLKLSPYANLRAGKFKPPVGLERLQSANDIAFIERGLPTSLVPNRDVGLQYFGSVSSGVVDYAVGVFNGVPDGGNADVDSNDAKDLIGRIYLTPFKDSDIAALQGLSFGIAGSVGDPQGATNATALPSYKSSGQQTFFSYKVNATNGAATAVADGNQTRIAPQFYYTVGRLGLLGEYVISEQDVKNGKGSDSLANDSWSVAASYVLTGEKASFKGVQPLSPFDLSKGQWGAFELVARIGELNVDDDAFAKGYADPKKSASSAENLGIGLNWYLTKNSKIAVDYEQTKFDGGASDGDRPDEKIVFTRYQINY
jgi:phosphate-selective porin OprO/OprP